MIIDPADPLTGADLFRLGEGRAISRAVPSLQFPLGSFSLRIEKNLSRPPALHFREPHRDDRRFLDYRQAGRADDLGHAGLLIRLNIEEENVWLIVRADGGELGKQDLARQV